MHFNKDEQIYNFVVMAGGINQKYQYNPHQFLKAKEYISGIQNGDNNILSKAITLIESSNPDHREIANKVITGLSSPDNLSIRIGITGSPGVGKSTFIEAFGNMICGQGHKIAVLTIDPSSEKSGGSILGDKTRMEKLLRNDHAFIRPTPSKGSLGGVAQYTKEAILLCEAAGYDIIIIETVGVGQSETSIHQMVDFFLLLMLAGAGDELQGIKRGIMELADCIAITKADSGNESAAKKAKITFENALHLFPPYKNGWKPVTHICSSIEEKGIQDIWNTIQDHRSKNIKSGWITNNRSDQNVYWMHQKINEKLKADFYDHPDIRKKLLKIEAQVKKGELNPFTAANNMLKNE